MLVLLRKESESVRIGDSVTVTVLSILGGKAKLGIEAPLGIRVGRDLPGVRRAGTKRAIPLFLSEKPEAIRKEAGVKVSKYVDKSKSY